MCLCEHSKVFRNKKERVKVDCELTLKICFEESERTDLRLVSHHCKQNHSPAVQCCIFFLLLPSQSFKECVKSLS